MNHIIPNWLKKVYPNNSIINASKLEGGVVSDVWRILTDTGIECVIRCTRLPADKHQVLLNLESAASIDFCLPNEIHFLAAGDSLITMYPWIPGEALYSFSDCLHEVLLTLSQKHAQPGFYSVRSIYSNAFEEARYVQENIDDFYNVLSPEIIRGVHKAASAVLTSLTKKKLNLLLDCRGRLTHGDPKPANVIRSNNMLTFIDWDKICTLSPESDIVYALFTGSIPYTLDIRRIFEEFGKIDDLSFSIFSLATKHLPDLYLIHDVYIYLVHNVRQKYISEQVFPLWLSWKEKYFEILGD